jgi:hypothetical protein
MRVARLGRALRGVELEDTECFVVRIPRGTSRDVFDERTRFDVLLRRFGRRLTSSIATLHSLSQKKKKTALPVEIYPSTSLPPDSLQRCQ